VCLAGWLSEEKNRQLNQKTMPQIAHRYELVLYSRRKEGLTLEDLAARAGVHPSIVEHFVELGLIEPAQCEGERFLFDASAVPRLRTICRLRESLGINLAGVAVVMDLLDKFCALQRENELLRSRL
jgi:transcriptional regulator with XRE-family HTH domain